MSENPPMAARYRNMVSKETQTESSFPFKGVNLSEPYDELSSTQFTELQSLRDMISLCMTEVAGSVYDLVAFKDIMFKLEEEFTSSLPITDMLLLSSKLFRRTSELGRLLGCFFSLFFADEHCDEHFHFAEVRILQKELRESKKKLKETEEEKINLQKMLTNLGQVAMDHGKAVELLEERNQALQLQTAALEDQMAVLFHQVNTDLEKNCKDSYEKVSLEVEIQERLNPTRATFSQTMDNLGQQIRSSRALITEVKEALLSCSQGPRTGEAYLAVEPSVRFKLKMLESNFSQIVGRFTAVKDTVAETANELMSALQDRKKILYLSYQHIRLYDLQNIKLRKSKALLAELREFTTDLLKKMQTTFPYGAIASVDRLGRITAQRWQGGYTLAAIRENKEKRAKEAGKGGNNTRASLGDEKMGDAPGGGFTFIEKMAAESELAALQGGGLRGNEGVAVLPPATLFDESDLNTPPFETVFELMEVVKTIDDNIDKLNENMTLEDEMSAFLKTLTLSVSTTERQGGKDIMHQQFENKYNQALMPTGTLQNSSNRVAQDSSPLSHDKEEMQSVTSATGSSGKNDGVLSKQAQQLRNQQEQIAKMQDDFSSKLGFLRQVYEARITDLEIKEASVQKGFSTFMDTTSSQPKSNSSGLRTSPVPKAAKGPKQKELPLVREGERNTDDALQAMHKMTDKDELLAARQEWQKNKPAVVANKKVRETAVAEVDRVQQDVSERTERKGKK
ncbi:hypothetical protein AGDE_07814 [Angomonas deanei]|uniref:Uncharacterized protein n=1 Tax=Angomonas deanei TaxID=59799 RepID=A0A7G2CBK7_9TRYP|nr:hypothetical protein AGDE_07814 [Angomonas deanei]CAD2216317.1 hypothetical protein, conserved [Angomonas deanei]|eukprot:EPY34822.1 hypothetical protein AGDE_07814 [Angomonas deanei]